MTLLFGDFEHLHTLELDHGGDCRLLGLSGDGCIFVEELYGEDDWLAQYKLSSGSGVIESVDEGDGENKDFDPLDLPDDIQRPETRHPFDYLDFSGARLRGMAVNERIDELVQSLTIAEKIDLVADSDWGIDPMRLIGISESKILAACKLDADNHALCRRIRIAYRLPKPQRDEPGMAYDYDSFTLHVLHRLPAGAIELPDLSLCLKSTQESDLFRPQDCMYCDGVLLVADGGDEDTFSAVHVFSSKSFVYGQLRHHARADRVDRRV